MTWRDRNGPRPPSRRRVENQLRRHVRELTGRPPLCLDSHNRPPFVPLLLAHRDWWLASHPQRQQGQDQPADRTPEIEASPPASRGEGHLGLCFVIALTFVGDLGTILAALSVLLAGLLLVRYVGSGLATATLDFRTNDGGSERPVLPGIAARLRARADRRHRVATARIDAYFRVLAADTALTLAAVFHDPAATDALTASLNEEEPR